MENLSKEKLFASRLAVGMAFCLTLIKLFTGIFINSLSVISVAMDSLLDLVTASFNFFSIRRAEKPADETHAFGHGKFESFASFVQALFIAGVGAGIIYGAIGKIRSGGELTEANLGIAVLAGTVVINIIVNRKITAVAKKTNSPALQAQALNFKGDSYTNGGVIVALLLTKLTGWQVIDPLISIGVAVYIIVSAMQIFRRAYDDLMDRSVNHEVRDDLQAIIDRHYPRLLSFHNLRTRQSGSHKHIDMHLVVCKSMSFVEAHELVEQLEDEIEEQIPNSTVIIHADPCSEKECPGEREHGCERLEQLNRREQEKIIFFDTLNQCHWNFEAAAEKLGMSTEEILQKLKESGLS